MNKVALAVIVKGTDDEAPLLDACLKSVAEHVDGIFIQLNAPKGQKISPRVRKIAQKYTDNIEDCVWTGNFVKARTANFAQVPKDYDFILWLDSDDSLENPEKVKETATVTPKGVSAIYACYDYAHDEYGNVTVPHYVARLVRNNGAYQWESSINDEKYAVHETLVETRTTGKRITEEWKVVHHASPERSLSSLYRNIELLEKMFENQQAAPDPRILFYLGTHYFDAMKFTEAKDLLQQYMQLSGWGNERSEALVYLGLIYDIEGKPGQAKHAYTLAISEAPNNPRPYTEIAEICLKGKRYDDAAQWAMKAIECKKRATAMALRPLDATFRPYVIYAKALTEMGGSRLEDAMKYVDKALKLRPNDLEALSLQENLENLIELRDLNRAYARLVRALGDDKERIKHLLHATPEKLLNSPLVAQVRSEYTVPKVWPKKSMVIYCGPSVIEQWGPNSLKGGIGGSEEAVIRLKVELEKQGWQVHVYATPGDEVSDTWHHYWDFNPNDEFDTVVAWRMPWFFDNEIKARKKYLWLHDVMEQSEFTPERLANLDKVIVLSNYHRSLFPVIPDDKIFLSSNGITSEEFNMTALDRNPKRCIYMSSHVRGLQLIYDMWPDVKKAVPEATLDIYYGWESYVNVNRDNPERMLWKEEMERQEKMLEGVKDHGKISQEQIVKEIFKSGVWVYPCPFPEISCITALKSQAGGAVPVSSNFAALNETVQFGAKIPMSQMAENTPVGKWDKAEITKFKTALIDMLQHPEKQEKIRPAMMKWARQQSWEGVARQWSSEML
jgi:tetratricopeptide (TPR) repeat protein